MFSIGIGAGSFLCERLSGRIVEIGLVPLGALGLTLFGADIYFSQSLTPDQSLFGPMTFIRDGSNVRVMIDIVMLGVSGGIYIVPLYALVQQRSELKKRSRIIAANNVLNALFMVVAALYALFILSTGVTVSTLFLIMAIMNVIVTLFIFTLVPEFVMRLLIWLLIHTVYRVDKTGLDKIPDDGPALLICNHVSFVDALILAGSIKRPIRFVMYFRIYQLPILSFIFKTANAIPIASPNEHAGLMKLAFNRISEAFAEGELVCIFPEGKITDSGEMGQFKSGVIRILERDPVPIVPLALRGLWGSFFSRKHGKAMTRWFPRGWFSRIELVAGDPIEASDASQESLYRRVSVLRGKKL
jgi:1-acyl-sn-glycerol-3-phosphate acyltransferase